MKVAIALLLLSVALGYDYDWSPRLGTEYVSGETTVHTYFELTDPTDFLTPTDAVGKFGFFQLAS